jgi:antitoxin component YwqK of YwqJK toxin-antitoxin module
MKPIYFVAAFFFSLQSYSQQKLVIGKSELVTISITPDEPELAEQVYVQSENGTSFCEAIQVYYDEQKRYIAYESYSRNDSCFVFQYWKDGSLKKFTLHITMQGHPVWWYDESYCQNGQLLHRGPSPNQAVPGKTVTYHCNGNKKLEWERIIIKDMWQPDGKMTRWFENGQIESESWYNKGKEMGEWVYYNESGKIIKREWYESGKLSKSENY